MISTSLTVTSAEGSASGKTAIAVNPSLTSGNSYKYKIASAPTMPSVGDVCSSGYTNWNGTDEITAETGKTIVVVEVDSGNKAVRIGSATIAAK